MSDEDIRLMKAFVDLLKSESQQPKPVNGSRVVVVVEFDPWIALSEAARIHRGLELLGLNAELRQKRAARAVEAGI